MKNSKYDKYLNPDKYSSKNSSRKPSKSEERGSQSVSKQSTLKSRHKISIKKSINNKHEMGNGAFPFLRTAQKAGSSLISLLNKSTHSPQQPTEECSTSTGQIESQTRDYIN